MDVEKSAGLGMVGLRKGIGSFVQNFSHMGINKAQKGLDTASHELNTFKSNPMPKLPDGSVPTRNSYPEHISHLNTNVNQAEKNLHNAKVSHNRTVGGTAIAAIGAGAGLGGYAAYQKSNMNPEVNDLMQQNQMTQNQFGKSASEELSEIIHDNLVERLEKIAAIAYIPVQVPDQGGQEDVAAAQQAEVAPLPQPVDPSQPDGSGGIDPAQLGMTQADQEQEGPVGNVTDIAPVTGGDPAFNANQAVVTNGAEPISPESQELQAILAAQSAERQQESQPAQQAVPAQQPAPAQQVAPAQQAAPTQQAAPVQEDEGEEEEEPKRQGAGSVSNAPAGEDKTAAELYERLEKTAAESYSVDDSPMGGTPGDQSKKVNNFWHKLSPAEVQEEDQTEPNGDRKSLYERLTLTSGGYDSASQAANLSKKAGEGAIDPDHDGDDDRPGSKNNPDKAEDDKKGVTAEAAKEEKEKKDDNKKDDDKKDDDKKDGEKKNPFEKSAFEIPGLGGLLGHLRGAGEAVAGHAGNALNAAKAYPGHLTGSTFHNADETLKAWNTPEAMQANYQQAGGIAGYRQHLEGLDAAKNNAASAMHNARTGTAIAGGVGLAGIGTGAAIHHHNQQQQQPMEQTASEQDEIMNGLFKEAAAMIINEEIPEVKQHVDIMNRIKF